MFKHGFGSKSCNYWLGNELLHQLSKDGLYKVRFDLQVLHNGDWYWAEYSTFVVDSEATKYQLTISGYSGNAGDAMQAMSTMKFTTIDSDNDIALQNCALSRGGGFWWNRCGPAQINACIGANLNGFGWMKLPVSPWYLKISRVWLMCP